MESSTDSDSDGSDKTSKSSDFDLQVHDDSDNAFLDSLFDSEAEGDPWELEAHPGDLLEFYFVLDSSRYH